MNDDDQAGWARLSVHHVRQAERGDQSKGDELLRSARGCNQREEECENQPQRSNVTRCRRERSNGRRTGWESEGHSHSVSKRVLNNADRGICVRAIWESEVDGVGCVLHIGNIVLNPGGLKHGLNVRVCCVEDVGSEGGCHSSARRLRICF